MKVGLANTFVSYFSQAVIELTSHTEKPFQSEFCNLRILQVDHEVVSLKP
jgi:hypothetical protein